MLGYCPYPSLLKSMLRRNIFKATHDWNFQTEASLVDFKETKLKYDQAPEQIGPVLFCLLTL